MKIGIDAQACIGNSTSGLGVYTRSLIDALMQERRNGFTFHLFSKEQKGDWNTAERLLWENLELPRRAKKEEVEILHVPAFAPPFLRPAKMVVTVHDLIGMIYPNQIGWPSRFYWGWWLPSMVKRADAIIADSENTKKDIMRLLHVAEEKIHVIYASGHENFKPVKDTKLIEALKEKFAITKKYFLFVGTIEPRKNLKRVIEAFLGFRKRGFDGYQLVIIGSKEFAHGIFFESLQKELSCLKESVIFTGYVEPSELNQLYAGAVAFVFPSLYEGFGIPILEAMASGTPVLASNVSSIPEVAGDAALFVNPYNSDEIAKGLERLANDSQLRESLIQKGFNRIKRFSWQETARKTMAVYEEVSRG